MSGNYPESALQYSLLPPDKNCSRRVGFSGGNLVHIQMWGWKEKEGNGSAYGSLWGRRREEGLKANLKGQGSLEAQVSGQGGGVSSFPKPITAPPSSCPLFFTAFFPILPFPFFFFPLLFFSFIYSLNLSGISTNWKRLKILETTIKSLPLINRTHHFSYCFSPHKI